ncbi:MAG: 2Fe-2S iron-sulfur cluster binding domain-containing protein [Xanthobacteraceae bacterium]|jgi:carbon-monoxide dehydrogenase small subunit|nr:2Fe-2S iron-sulfur cluster binding domain-containing protein [Xanthobacteraceae bacterium]
MNKNISIIINGKSVEALVEPRTSLADFLRDKQRLTGTKLACEHGVCGACTVLINGAPGRACITFAATLDGAKIQTIEGFENDDVMEVVRNAFHTEHGLQCGFCTAGMLITARDIVTRFPNADEQTIRTELSGNLCRCTGYMGIVKAVQKVLEEMPAKERVRNPVIPKNPTQTFPFKTFQPKSSTQTNTSSKRMTAKRVSEKDVDGWIRLTDRFIVARNRDETWRLFSDFARMASCMPGASLTKADGDQLEGQVRIAFGPIRASFKGNATVQRDDKNYEGVIAGGGNDSSSGSRAKGQVTYQLLGGNSGENTIVNLTLEFQLQGALAQFSRVGLIQEFSARLISSFAKNLSDEIEGRRKENGDKTELRVSGLVWSVLAARLKALWLKISGIGSSNRSRS